MHRREFITGMGAAALATGARSAAAQDTAKPAAGPEPQTRAGHARIAFEFPGLLIGTADYVEGPTGCTVFSFPRRAAVDMDVRGGASGTIGDYSVCDAICLAGGSAMGLEAATGVAAELFERRGQAGRWTDIPRVMGAVIYDLAGRNSTIYPDKALGRAALRAAQAGSFALGRCGAGSNARAGKAWNPRYTSEPAGQGGAVGAIGATRIGVFTVVNAIGAIFDRSGKVVRGNRDAGGHRASIAEGIASKARTEPPQGNTTLTVLVTNQRFDRLHLRQIGRQVHASMARAIQPFHGSGDGDVLYAVSTMEIDNPRVSDFTLAAAAGEVAWDAVLSSFAPD